MCRPVTHEISTAVKNRKRGRGDAVANEAVVPYRTKLPRQKSGNSVRQQLQYSAA